MAANIYTKAFTNRDKWETACQLVNIINKDDQCQFLRRTVSAERVNIVPDGDNPQGEVSQEEPMTACTPCERSSFVAAPAPLCHIPGVSNSKPILFRPPRSVQSAEKNASLKGKWFANVFGARLPSPRRLAERVYSLRDGTMSTHQDWIYWTPELLIGSRRRFVKDAIWRFPLIFPVLPGPGRGAPTGRVPGNFAVTMSLNCLASLIYRARIS